MNKVFAVIVTYNPDEQLLKQQHAALQDQVDGIIYVDNHSESISYDETLEDSVIIKNCQNFGLAKAQNQGVEFAKSQGADFIVFFDQDSIPCSWLVDALMTCYQKHYENIKVALVGPAIRNRYSGCVEDEKGVVFQGLRIRRVKVGECTDVSYCIASGSLIPMKVLDEVGLMEEKLFIDGVDQEWCFRAKHFGYHIIQTNKTWLSHALGNGTPNKIKSHSPMREYYMERNCIWMAKTHYFPVGLRFRKVLTTVARPFVSLFNGGVSYTKADIMGFIDGLKL